MVDGGSWWRIIDDQDRCEWVNVSYGSSSPGQKAVKELLLLLCTPWSLSSSVMSGYKQRVSNVNRGYGFGYHAKSAFKIWFGLVSLLASMVWLIISYGHNWAWFQRAAITWQHYCSHGQWSLMIKSIIVTKFHQRPACISDKKVNRTTTIFYDIQDPSKVQKITEFTFSTQFGLF